MNILKSISLQIILVATFLLSSTPAHAIQESSPLTLDGRIKTFVYVPNEVYVFTGHYRVQSTIELAPDERITTITIGDSIGWVIKESGNRVFLKPVEPDAETNMTIFTDKRTYLFELLAEEMEDLRDDNITFITKFQYPNTHTINGTESFRQFATPQTVKKTEVQQSPENFNFNYSITGSESITPLKVFDDGTFTYIEYKDSSNPIPAIFKVDKEGQESLINFRVDDGFIIIEEVSHMFTLRYGNEIACIFNEANPLTRIDL